MEDMVREDLIIEAHDPDDLIHEAVLGENLEEVLKFLDPTDRRHAYVNAHRLNGTIQCDGKAPLHLAVQGGHVEIVKALLGAPDIDVNVRCPWRRHSSSHGFS